MAPTPAPALHDWFFTALGSQYGRLWRQQILTNQSREFTRHCPGQILANHSPAVSVTPLGLTMRPGGRPSPPGSCGRARIKMMTSQLFLSTYRKTLAMHIFVPCALPVMHNNLGNILSTLQEISWRVCGNNLFLMVELYWIFKLQVIRAYSKQFS